MRHWLPTTVLLLVLASPVWSWSPREGPQPNVRPFLDLGYSVPSGYRGLDVGFGLGLGLEIERTPRASLLFRVALDWLTETDDETTDWYGYYGARKRSTAVMNWTIGARGYLRPEASIRPYGEFDLGVRMGGDGTNDDGLAVTPRIGIAWASFGGTGLSLDSGFNFVVRYPDRNGIVPVRLAIVFR